MTAQQESTDIIYLTLFNWEFEYSSVSGSMTKELIKNNRVLYVNAPYSLRDLWTYRNAPAARGRIWDMILGRTRLESKDSYDPEKLQIVVPPVLLPINWLPPGKIYDFFLAVNRKRFYKVVQKAAQQWNISNPVILNCFNPYIGLPSRDMKLSSDGSTPRTISYQCIDDMEEVPYTAKHGRRLEKELMAQSDFGITTAMKLREMNLPYNPTIEVIHNAANFDLFHTAMTEDLPIPKDISHAKKPIIMFTGNLDKERIDYQALKTIAEHFTDGSIVIVGPINGPQFYEMGIDQLPNVITTGSKDISELPAYLQQADVTIIPYAKNKLTASIYPLKINEYLAAGRPLVVAAVSADIRKFEEVVYLIDDQKDWISTIEQALEENSTDKINARVAFSARNTWSDRIAQLFNKINEYGRK